MVTESLVIHSRNKYKAGNLYGIALLNYFAEEYNVILNYCQNVRVIYMETTKTI
jgi:hypothetical protein